LGVTGDGNFYQELIDTISECVDEVENNDAVDDAIRNLAENL